MSKTLIKRLPHAEGLDLPSYATEASAGADLRAAITSDIVLAPGQTAMVPTGLAIALAPGTEGQVRPRSGLAAKHSVTVVNAPGTVDADYRGEVRVLLINLGQDSFIITRGMRIAQLVVAPYIRTEFQLTDDLDDTIRGEGGFGSTGV